LNILEFALPDFFDRPTNLFQFGPIFAIALAVSLDLGSPEVEIGFRELADLATMAMPETSMNEDRLLTTDEGDVGPSGEVFPMEPVAIAQSVQKRANDQLGLGMLRANPRHQSAAARLGSVIHHREGLAHPRLFGTID
jgi:hypothetical protein